MGLFCLAFLARTFLVRKVFCDGIFTQRSKRTSLASSPVYHLRCLGSLLRRARDSGAADSGSALFPHALHASWSVFNGAVGPRCVTCKSAVVQHTRCSGAQQYSDQPAEQYKSRVGATATNAAQQLTGPR
jgi:hypothetical protein